MDSSEDIDCVGESSHKNYGIKQQYHSTVNTMIALFVNHSPTKVNLDSMKIADIYSYTYTTCIILKYKSINS